MFWGLIMEPKRRYAQKVKKAFHVTMACLDISTGSDEPTQVLYSHENRNYLLCTLQKDKEYQCKLDLFFDVNNKVSFMSNGTSNVHLTGYVEDDTLSEFDNLDEEVEEEVLSMLNSKSDKKRKAVKAKENKSKKLKTSDLLKSTFTDEDQDDPDFQCDSDGDDDDESVQSESADSEEHELEDPLLQDILGESDEEDENDSGEEEEDSDRDEDDDDDDDDDEQSEEENEQIMEAKKPKSNGIVEKGKNNLDNKNKRGVEKNKQLDNAQQNKKSKATNEKNQQIEQKKSPAKGTPQKRTVEGGVIIEDLKVGNGQIAKPGRVIQVYYEGRLKKNSKMFDSVNKGDGFKFRLGKQDVIKGWDVGVAGMKVGGKRRITCPPAMAYGQNGSPPRIPPNATLVFEVELRNVC